MSYLTAFQSGNVVLPLALLFQFKALFDSTDDFLVWQFFYAQNSTGLEELAPSQVAESIGKTVAEVNRSITHLTEKGLLDVKTIELSGEIEMIFDASPALAKLDHLLGHTQHQEVPVSYTENGQTIKQLIDDLEQAMGMLNPMILEDVQKMVNEDMIDPDLIREALREAVFNNKTNWKYIQAILRNWRQDGVTTLRQVEERRRQREATNPANVSVSDDFLSAMNLWRD